MSADVLSLSPKMPLPLLEVDDMLMQDHKTVFVQKSTKCIEFILNLVKWLIWQPWRNAEARSYVLVQWITFQVCWNMSFPARPGKISISIEWCGWALRCIVFGVAVILETPRISDPTAFVASPSDHICWTPSISIRAMNRLGQRRKSFYQHDAA